MPKPSRSMNMISQTVNTPLRAVGESLEGVAGVAGSDMESNCSGVAIFCYRTEWLYVKHSMSLLNIGTSDEREKEEK